MKRNAGVTLFELLVTLTVVAVFFCSVLGYNQYFFEKNQIDLLEKQLTNSIHYSRNRALTSGHDVTLNSLTSSGDWSAGMILFRDNATHHYTGQESVLYHWKWQRLPQLLLVWKGFKSKDYLTFSKTLRRSTVNGHFLILRKGSEVRRIAINRFGRVS